MTRGFPDPLVLKSYDRNDRAEWVVVEPFRYCCPDGRTITVPPGAITDLASVPAGGLLFLKRDSLGLRYPSQPHDWLFVLCRLHRAYPDLFGPCPDWLTLSYTNQIFRWALEDDPWAGWARTRAAHLGVRIGGRWSWGKYDQKLLDQQLETLRHYQFSVDDYREWTTGWVVNCAGGSNKGRGHERH